MHVPTMSDSRPSHVQLARPLGDCQAFAVPFNPMGERSIAILLKGIGPSAIIWRISFGIVKAINGKILWTWTHIGKELFKPSPRWVNAKAFSAIAIKQHRVRICASLNHARPNAVFSALVHAVFGDSYFHGFTLLASARFRASLQLTASVLAFGATFASTQPPLRFMGFVPDRLWYLMQYGQASKYTAGQINHSSSHKGQYIVVSVNSGAL